MTLALESSVEDSASHIDTLTLRCMSLSSLCPTLSVSLPLLSSLSLSHNSFETLEGFENLANLRDLNLNFNRVGSVENLGGLKFLKALYLSNNLMDDVAIRLVNGFTLLFGWFSLTLEWGGVPGQLRGSQGQRSHEEPFPSPFQEPNPPPPSKNTHTHTHTQKHTQSNPPRFLRLALHPLPLLQQGLLPPPCHGARLFPP